MKSFLILSMFLGTSLAMAQDVDLLDLAASQEIWVGNQVTEDESLVGKRVTEFLPPGVRHLPESQINESDKEVCLIPRKIPGGRYFNENDEQDVTGDIKKEDKYCKIDFYNEDPRSGKVAGLCPKTWSTSPGTIVWEIKNPNEVPPAIFESTMCSKQKSIPKSVAKKFAKYKMSMNDRTTSATFSNSSLMYYHLSRYLHSTVYVPVSVYRSMDKGEHYNRVSSKAPNTKQRTQSKMNFSGWEILKRVGRTPPDQIDRSVYPNPTELLTDSKNKVFGIFIRGKGERYDSIINGTRESGWGVGQNKDFMATAAFTALRSSKSELQDAINEGIERARRRGGKLAAELGYIPGIQMAFWMKEISEIVILDYIMSQQDRIGNIDFRWYWNWIDEDGIRRWKKADVEKQRRQLSRSFFMNPPSDIKGEQIVLLQRTQINDNDAGGKVPYANFTKSVKMMESIRRLNPLTYAKILNMSRDFQNRGELFRYISEKNTFRLSTRQRNQLVSNTHLAANILRNSCKSGLLHFDLDPEYTFEARGEYNKVELGCDLEDYRVIGTGRINIR